MELAHELQAYPEATWYDRFVYLDFSVACGSTIQHLPDRTRKNAPSKASSLAALLFVDGEEQLGLARARLFKSCRRIARSWPVPLALADTYVGCATGRIWKRHGQGKLGRFEFCDMPILPRFARTDPSWPPPKHEWSAPLGRNQ